MKKTKPVQPSSSGVQGADSKASRRAMDADRISDRILDLLNEELKRPDFSPLAGVCGQLLALVGFLESTAHPLPLALEALASTAHRVITQISQTNFGMREAESSDTKAEGSTGGSVQ